MTKTSKPKTSGRYSNEKALMLSEVDHLARIGLLDRLGGSLAMRLDDGNILITPTTASFRRWQISVDELVVMDPGGDWIDGGAYRAAAAAPLFVALLASFPQADAIAHSHCPYSLAFASAGEGIPAATNGAELLGEIPCIAPSESDTAVKERAIATHYDPTIPSAFVPRADVYAVNERLGPLVAEQFGPRVEELTRHGLGFTLAKHGLFTMGRHLEEATENIERIEAAARTAILSSFISRRV